MRRTPPPPRSDKSPRRASSEQPYGVGYGKPPATTQFKPGKSGNPKGRPRKALNLSTIVEETLNERVTLREGERSRSVSKREALVLTLVNGALRGEAKSLVALLALLRALGMVAEESVATAEAHLSPDEQALLAQFLASHGLTAPADGTGNQNGCSDPPLQPGLSHPGGKLP